MENLGKYLVIFGVIIVVIGGMVWLASRWFGGDMPGTIRIQSGGFTCLIPLLGSLVLSVVLTVVLNLLVRFFNR